MENMNDNLSWLKGTLVPEDGTFSTEQKLCIAKRRTDIEPLFEVAEGCKKFSAPGYNLIDGLQRLQKELNQLGPSSVVLDYESLFTEPNGE